MSAKGMSVREKFAVEFVTTGRATQTSAPEFFGGLPDLVLFDEEVSELPETFNQSSDVDPVAELRMLFGRVDS